MLQPQTCDGSWTADSIDAMVEYVKSTHRVDEERIYLTGLSLGGGGTWTYASSRPGKLAAIVPIAGTEKAQSLIQAASHVPTWAFHNYNDTNVGDRMPLTVAVSTDGGKTWPHKRNIVNIPGDTAAYPYIIETADGRIHGVYTSEERSVINYFQMDESDVTRSNQ